MIKYNKFDPSSGFIDEQGWEQSEQTFTLSPKHYLSFLKKFESVQKEQERAKYKLKTLQKQKKMKSSRFFVDRKNYDEYRESLGAKRSQFPSRCIFQSIDLSNNKRSLKYQCGKRTKQQFKRPLEQEGKTQKLKKPRKVHKLSSPPEKANSIQNNKKQLNKTRVLRVQLNELAEKDPMAKRYLRNYLKEKKQEIFHFPFRQRIFQLPQSHSLFA